ncbi:hypothetical protein HDV04_004301 [Boothiomyces sp. JEL0838]|nr:hypothetical protein HDV04_004301 [Boothiomyces sp. JEL0838]
MISYITQKKNQESNLLSQKLRELESENQALKAENLKFREESEALRAENIKVREEKRTLRDQILKFRDGIKQLSGEIQTLRNENSQLSGEIQNLRNENSQLSEGNKQISGMYLDLSREVLRLRNENTYLKENAEAGEKYFGTIVQLEFDLANTKMELEQLKKTTASPMNSNPDMTLSETLFGTDMNIVPTQQVAAGQDNSFANPSGPTPSVPAASEDEITAFLQSLFTVPINATTTQGVVESNGFYAPSVPKQEPVANMAFDVPFVANPAPPTVSEDVLACLESLFPVPLNAIPTQGVVESNGFYAPSVPMQEVAETDGLALLMKGIEQLELSSQTETNVNIKDGAKELNGKANDSYAKLAPTEKRAVKNPKTKQPEIVSVAGEGGMVNRRVLKPSRMKSRK